MASLDVARPAAQEQLAVLGRQAGVATLPIVPGQPPVEIARRALNAARLQGFDVLMLDTAGRLHVDQALMDEMKAVAEVSAPNEVLLVADAMTGQDAVNVAKSFVDQIDADRRHPHPHGRRCARRRGALDARGHRQADQVRRRRRGDRQARGLPSRAGGRPHPRHGRRRQPGRAGAGDDPGRRSRGDGRQDGEGPVRPQRPAPAAPADAAHGRARRARRDAARHGQDEEPDQSRAACWKAMCSAGSMRSSPR